MPEPEPGPPEPAPEEAETPAPPEACSEGQQASASSLTLQVRPSACPGVIPSKGRPFLGSPGSHDFTSASEAGDPTPLRSGCVTLDRRPNPSGPVSRCE